jgi:energy-coupling factor transport system substrate-specific component
MVRVRYTVIDYALLGVAAIVSGIIFYATWFLYYGAEAVGGKIFAKLVSYGLWFIGAPLAASMIRKPGSAFLGETLGALIESIIPTIGGFSNLIYGVAQGAASEIAYLIFRYKKYTALVGALAGALAGFPCVAVDAVMYGEIAPPPVMTLWLIAAVTSGAVYGYIAALAGSIVVGKH